MRASLLRSCGITVALAVLAAGSPTQLASAATIDGQYDQTGPVGAGSVFDLAVLGRGGVPVTGVGSVALNVTVTRPSATSFVTVWPTGQPRPNASNLNFTAGQTVPNMVIVPVGAGGQISIFNESGTTDVLVDVLGWFPVGPSFTGLTPARLLDTRVPSGGTVDGASNGIGRLGGGTVFDLPVSGRGGVPASGVGSVALNVTVARPSATSYLSVWPTGQPRPNASSLNFTPGQTVPNMVIVPVGMGGQISILLETGATDVLVDVLGWFPIGPSFTGLTPSRLLDTRVPSGGTVDGTFNGIGQLRGATVFDLSVSGRGGVPASGAGSVALNVTVARPSEAGFLTVWPKGQPRPNASNLNFVPGQTVPNMVIVPIGADGQISIINESGSTDVLVDVLGWFPIGPSFTGLTPARLLDSRKPSDSISSPGRTDLVVARTDIDPITVDGYTYRYYENLAYPCSISGNHTFAIGTATGSSDTAARPLWVKMHGGGKGWFDDAGAPRPSAVNKTQESLAALVGHSDGGLTKLVRETTAGFRVLVVSMCSHDIYAGANTTDPNNPNLDANGRVRTTNGLLAVKAAIAYTESAYPTTDFFLHGTSAGGAGSLNVGWALQRQGLPPAGIVTDAGLINQEAEFARVQQGTCGAAGQTIDALTRSLARWAPEITAVDNQPDMLVSRGELAVPIMHVWNKGDLNTCGNAPMACPLRDGSTPIMWSATCGHMPLALAIAALPASRHSYSMGLCVDASATDTNPCDRHVVTLVRAVRNNTTISPEHPADFLPVIVNWVLDRLNGN